MSAPTEATPAATSRRAVWKWLARLALGAFIVAILLSRRETAATVWSTLRGVSPLVILGAVGFYLGGQVLSAWKWQLLLRARGARISLASCCRIYAAGMFGNLWLPTNVGGDALRAALLVRQCPDLGRANAVASILVERLTGFAALLGLAAGALALRGADALGWRMLGIAAGIIAFVGALWWLVGKWRHPKIVSLRAALNFYWQSEHRAVLGQALALSLAFQISQVLLNTGLARATELDLPARVFWWLGPLLSLSGLIPAGIGGLGVREAAAVALLQGWNVASGQIVAWSLLWQATVWLSSLPGILWVRNSPREKD